jgi:hypothetical protein
VKPAITCRRDGNQDVGLISCNFLLMSAPNQPASPAAVIAAKAVNGAVHGYIIAGSLSLFLRADSMLASVSPAKSGVAPSWSNLAKTSASEAWLGAKLVGDSNSRVLI